MNDECEACAKLREDMAKLRAEMLGHWKLDDERFRARDEAGREIAKSLDSFKSLSNEWRGALSDLSLTKLGKDEYEVRHREIEGKITSESEHFNRRYIVLDDKIDGLSSTQQQANGARTALVTAVAIIGTLVAIAIAIASRL